MLTLLYVPLVYPNQTVRLLGNERVLALSQEGKLLTSLGAFKLPVLAFLGFMLLLNLLGIVGGLCFELFHPRTVALNCAIVVCSLFMAIPSVYTTIICHEIVPLYIKFVIVDDDGNEISDANGVDGDIGGGGAAVVAIGATASNGSHHSASQGGSPTHGGSSSSSSSSASASAASASSSFGGGVVHRRHDRRSSGQRGKGSKAD